MTRLIVLFVSALLIFGVQATHRATTVSADPPDKLSSHIERLVQLQAGGNLATDAVTRSVQLDLAPSGGGSLQVDSIGRVMLNIRVADTSPATINAMVALGLTVSSVSSQYRNVTGSIAPGQIAALAALPAVQNIREALRPGTDREDLPAQVHGPADFACGAPSGNANSEGNAQLNANAARTAFGVTGAGVIVGVESDSYNAASGPVTTPANDIASDDLPGVGNPCGFVTPNNILQDCVPATGCIDEGRAMMQIIHDLAPGSALAFAGPTSELDFATQLTALHAAGATVFSDDLNYFEDPFYQEGPIGVAAGNALATGMLSFTSAGNTNGTDAGINWNGYEASAYRPMACPAVIPAGHDCHNFGTAGSPDATYGLTMQSSFNYRPILQWAEPRFGVTTDLDFYLLNSTGTSILAQSIDVNPGVTGTQLPYEFFSGTAGSTSARQLVVARKTASGGTPRFKFIFFRTGSNITNVEYAVPSPGDTDGHMMLGHHCSPNFLSIAATNGALAGTTLETYSSFGPCTFYFGPVVGATAAAPITAQVIPKPDVVASDCTTNTFFLPGPPYLFCGTSASSPHGAAVAALLKSHIPSLTPAQIRNAIVTTATPMSGGPDQVGNGLINALAAMNLVSEHATTTALTSSLNPSTVGDSVTFTATVTDNTNSAPVTTGTVTFKDGATTLGVPVALNGSGQATFTTSGLTLGSHGMSAEYSGVVGSFSASTGTLTQTVNAPAAHATTTVLASSLNPSIVGASVTFTATVTDNTNSAPVTTGTVTFSDGATALGAPMALNGSGQATFTTSSLTVGSHTMGADYSGTSGFNASSGTLTQTVNAPAPVTPPTVTTTSPATAITQTSATLSGNVTSIGGGPLSARGIVLAQNSVNPNPQIGGTGVTVLTDAASTIGIFSEGATGLLPGTNYAFKAFATNSGGTSYGAVVIFTTATLPAPVAAGPKQGAPAPTQSAPVVKKTFNGSNNATIPAAGGTATLTFTITNPNPTALTGIGFVDTMPAGSGITVNAGSTVGSCDAGIILLTGTTVTLAGATLPASSSCSFSVTVTAATGGSWNNQVVANANGTGFGAPAVATLNVGTPKPPKSG